MTDTLFWSVLLGAGNLREKDRERGGAITMSIRSIGKLDAVSRAEDLRFTQKYNDIEFITST